MPFGIVMRPRQRRSGAVFCADGAASSGECAALQQAVAAGRHHVRDRRQPEIALTRPSKRRPVAAGRRKIAVDLAIRADAPFAVGLTAKVELTMARFTAGC
jgi:hypothetical protein